MFETLLFVANLLYLASYSVRDILWLRILSVAGMMLCLPKFFYGHDWQVASWHAVFIVINGYHVVRLFLQRRPIQLTPDEEALHRGPLRTLTPHQVRALVAEAEWFEASPGEELVAENADLEHLIVVVSGRALVRAGGREIAEVSPGQLVGEMSLLTKGKTTAEVVATSPVRFARWKESYFEELGERDHDLAMGVQAAIGLDLVGKLLSSRGR